MKFRSHCRNIADKVKRAFQGYRAIAKANWGIRNKQLAQMYKAIFVPMITYGAGAWAKGITKTDLGKLVTAQRAALTIVTRAYCTTSTPALLVIAGVAPIEYELQKEFLRHATRSGQTVRIGNAEYNPASADAEQQMVGLEDSQNQLWQQTWESDTRGRTTFEFFPSITKRQQADWVEPTYYLTQYLCGHGNFRSKLRKFSLTKNKNCQCGREDTPYHTFFECGRFQDSRDIFRREVEGVGVRWPPTWAQTVAKNVMPKTVTFVNKVLKNKELWDKGRWRCSFLLYI